MKQYLFILSIFTFFSCKTELKVQDEETISIGLEGEKLDSLLVPYVEKLRLLTDNEAGLAIGVAKGQETIYTKYFGFSNLEQRTKVDANTVFHVASLSKPFVAFAVAKLIEQEKLSLDDKIVELIPEFKMKGTGYDSITIKHILTHSSGIPTNISPDDWTNPSFGENALNENLDAVKDHELDFVPGTQFNYSNSAFDILGLVISRVSNRKFSDFITSEIFAKAGMNHSMYEVAINQLPNNVAMSYSYGLETQRWQPYPYNEKLFPSSGLLSSLEDMLTWTKIHLGNGTYEGKTILRKAYFDLLVAPHFDTPWNDKIGLSWFLQSYLNRPIIMHQGQDTGFESLVYIYPTEGISIVVLANRDFARTARIMNAVSEILFDEALKPYSVSGKYQFSEVYLNKGIDEAKRSWLQLKQDTTDIFYADDDDILTTGAILENGGKWKETKEILEYYCSINENSTYAFRLLGNANLNLGDTVTALSNYERCLQINPDYEKAKIAIGKIRDKNGQ